MKENLNEVKEKLNDEFLLQALINESIDVFRDNFFTLHEYDQAQFYEKVGPDIRQKIYQFLSPQELQFNLRST
ncbi:Magnesium transporter MgtE OS=Ureibacillus acetophenoni OX=614649 GN=SAMN05877842_101258 PE=3 SV=1 [Ureibacillus acetophenoni]